MQADPHDDPVYLGFALPLHNEDLYRLRPQFLPLGKIGGKPSWLNPRNLPDSNDLLCKVCEKPMCFLTQVCANSVDDPVHSFHRSLFIFICRDPKCSKANDASNFVAFRCGLPRKNDFYSFEGPMDPDLQKDEPNPFSLKDPPHLCNTCGCFASKKCAKCQEIWYCSREHQALDWPTHKPKCGEKPREGLVPINPLNRFVFKEFGMEVEQEYLPSEVFDLMSDEEDDYDSDDGETETEEEKELRMKALEDFNKLNIDKNPDLTKEDLENAVAEQEKDSDFTRFSKIVTVNPDQVIRYKRCGEPLLATCRSKLPDEIEPCGLCGAPRRFELQLMPHLLSLIDVDAIGVSIDWASVYIYTCSANCQVPNDGYAKEFVAKQDFL